MDELDSHQPEWEINILLSRFFLAFDERDWDAMSLMLADEIFVDYSSSGREEPSIMSGLDFVARRKGALDDLAKQHSFSNLLLYSEGAIMHGRCNYLILRFLNMKPPEGDDFFHSCGSYLFDFLRTEAGWKISSITQRALRSWGNKNLHGQRTK
ncbi:nuclear transport factor 2 family protein [Agrobacterium sp. BA1120]|uniref:nuclear transport factor 2 family protein n=1 Tax=Agrobacterium sp. BA1120 TaxID=3228927 RepID=UPI00336A109D